MNIAYSRYLQNALEHSTLTDEEKQGAHAFLKFLSTYKPTGLNVREPDFYGYGDAFGQYGVTYFDKQTLEDYGIDPDELVQRLASFTLAHPGEPGGLTADEIRHLNLPCGSYGYESEAVDAWLDELADQLEKR